MTDKVTAPQTPKDDGATGFNCSVSSDTSPRTPEDDDVTDFGDSVSTEDEEIDLVEVVEPWSKYDCKATPNVFYPICLGEVLNERYLVEHKIDAGGFSTVWMALDLQENKDVAVKVIVEDAFHLVTYLDTFLLPGNNCHHRVMVLPLMGPCLDRYTVDKFAITTRISAAKQSLEALETLHKAGIVHRDLNERNRIWGMAPLQHLSRSAKYEALGRPLKQTIPSAELWKRGESVRPMEIPENLRTDDFYLGDFGLAMKVGDSVAQTGYPPMHYMINFSELYLGQPPFNPWYRGGVLTSIINFLVKTRAPKKDFISEIARYRPDTDPDERELVLSIMQKVFIYSPEKRLTATQLLADPSFKALMARCRDYL
ncbi:kinase-like protein [Aspergillus undulatus]|uniref:kinase-like protein n=1 Tax=Aspergillus undulatus TaxID=1810928 RepID=UPI003CCC8FCD